MDNIKHHSRKIFERKNIFKHLEENTHKHNRFPPECASAHIPHIGAQKRLACRHTAQTHGHSHCERSPLGCSHTSGKYHSELEDFRDSLRSTYGEEDRQVWTVLSTQGSQYMNHHLPEDSDHFCQMKCREHRPVYLTQHLFPYKENELVSESAFASLNTEEVLLE